MWPFRATLIAILGVCSAAVLIVLAWPGCLVEEVCYSQADCPGPYSCFSLTGRCSKKGYCAQDADCPKAPRVPADRRCGPKGVCFDPTCASDADCPDGWRCGKNQLCNDGTCQLDGECPPGQICDQQVCGDEGCTSDEDCPPGRKCVDGVCELEALQCPTGMVSIEEIFCVDIYEASRPDATEYSAGSDGTMATSRVNVIPWQVTSDSNGVAQAACEAAGKRLCSEDEWRIACRGPADTEYGYGDVYEPMTCNGIDTFCDCEEGPCAGHDPCPYAGCFHDCRSDTPFRLYPTGSDQFSGCTNAYGVFDMNGNVWEHVLDGDDTRIRGGAFNCSDSREYHRCDYIPTHWKPSAKGFRCCWRPEDGD